MRLPLSILIAVAFAVAVVFAIPNRDLVTVRFWPFDLTVELPLYLSLFAACFFGFFFGWIGAWLAQRKWRKRVREQSRRIEHLENELMAMGEAAATHEPAETPKVPGIPMRR